MTTRTLLVTAAVAASIFLAADHRAAAAAPAPAAGAPAAATTAPPFNAEALANQAIAQVRDSLHLTDDQAARIQPLLAEHMTRLRQTLIDYSDPSGSEYPALMQEFKARRDAFQASMSTILDPGQMKEFAIIRQQVDGQLKEAVCAARLQAVSARIALRPDQQKSVGTILCDDFEKKRTLISGMTTSSGGLAVRQSPTPAFQAVQDATEVQLRKVLTPEQMKAYEAYRDGLKEKARSAS
jgi:hypothetical protein